MNKSAQGIEVADGKNSDSAVSQTAHGLPLRNGVKKAIRIMDTTLRDGEQTKDVSFNAHEKLAMAGMLLDKLEVDFVEVCSARVSEGEMETVKGISGWAKEKGFLGRIEILGFVDYEKSVDWIKEAGCRKLNLLAKGSERHLRLQLGKNLEEHLTDIAGTIDCAKSSGVSANIYLEDWSNGMIHSKDYVFGFLDGIKGMGFERIMLPDTLGVLSPAQVSAFIGELVEKYPEMNFDFHAHNDYGLATANSLAAVQAGAKCIHTTINGLGERTGNAALEEVVISINDLSDCTCSVRENLLSEASSLVEKFSLRRLPPNKPIVGKAVFTQTAGIHADGDKKGDLYKSRLSAERFGKSTEYSLGKLSGKASLDQNLSILGIELGKDEKAEVLKKIIELGDKKQGITTADLPFIIADVLKRPDKNRVKISKCMIVSGTRKRQSAKVTLKLGGKSYFSKSLGDGGYDAFMNALKKISLKTGLKIAQLTDYEVGIPPGGKTDALIETKITWRDNGKSFQTIGIDPDQAMAAVKATEKMLNLEALWMDKKIAKPGAP